MQKIIPGLGDSIPSHMHSIIETTVLVRFNDLVHGKSIVAIAIDSTKDIQIYY